MKVQTALRIEESILDSARREAERQNRSLANFIETALADSLVGAGSDIPVLSLIEEDDLADAVAIDDQGRPDAEETARFHHLMAISRRNRGE